MGATRLALHLDNASRIFYPGQVITGKVAFVNEVALKVKGLTITFFGEAEVYWTEAEAQSDTVSPYRGTTSQSQLQRHVHKEYRNQETFLCQEIVLFGQADAEGGEDVVIPPGIQAYPFTFQLPVTGLPTSFIGSPFGFVKYTVEARLKRPLFRFDKMEQEFYVNGILDLSFIPNASQPYATNERLNFGWLCCDEGCATMDLSLDRIGYLPGERLEYSASILNFSSNLVTNIRASFVQVTDFKTFDRDKRLVKTLKEIVYTMAVGGQEVERWNDSFTIPNVLLPTNLAGSRIITVVYMVRVDAEVGNKSLSLVAPVIIGTEPCPLPIAPPGVASSSSRASSNNISSTVEITTATGTGADHLPPLIEMEDEDDVEEDGDDVSKRAYPSGYKPELNPFMQAEPEDGLITFNSDENNDNDTTSIVNSVTMSEDDGLQ